MKKLATNNILIRNAMVDELNRVNYVTKISYKTPFVKNGIVTKPHVSKELEENFSKNKIGILVACCSGKIVGAIKYRKNEELSLYVYQLVVLKTYRYIGVGSLLLKEVEKIARKKKIKKITLDCMKEKKLPEYYKKFKYRIDRVKKEKDYHLVYMSKYI